MKPRRWPALVTLIALTLGLTLGAPTPAHAASDVVRRLVTDYTVTADGLLHVRQEIDWQFPETGRRGIEVDLVTTEVWDDDPSQVAVYEITDLGVESPTGAPATFQTSPASAGTDELLRIRIGDPDQTLDTDRHTYVLTYTVAGALRTFDGQSELTWDVTSTDYPAIDEFHATITAPGGVPRARCLVGASECAASVVDGVATLTAEDVGADEPLTVVGALTPGAVAGAEPHLRHRSPTPSVEGLDSTFTVDESGRLSVEHRLAWRLPAGARRDSRTFSLPVRRAHTFTRDTITTISDVHVRAEGAEADVELTGTEPLKRGDRAQLAVDLERANADAEGVHQVVVAYAVEGAVVGDPAEATLHWPAVGLSLPAWAASTITVELPGEVGDVDCGAGGSDPCRGWRVTRDGSRAVLQGEPGALLDSRQGLAVTFAGVGPGLPDPTVDRFTAAQLRTAAEMGVAALAALLGAWLLRLPGRGARDRAFVGVPGVVGGPDSPVHTIGAPTQQDVPVRFHPPDTDLITAGALLHREFHASHLAAALVDWAVAKRVDLAFDPLAVTFHAGVDQGETTHPLAFSLVKSGHAAGDPLDDDAVRSLVAAGRGMANRVLNDRHLVHEVTPARTRTAASTVGAVLVFLGIPATVVNLLTGGALFPLVQGAAALGLALGLVLRGRRGHPRRVALAPTGTALLQQTLGFRQYIETAEADQLSFEADADVYARYLPWAVLFDLTERWLAVGRDWAARGLIDLPDETLLAGLTGLTASEDRFRRAADRIAADERRAARERSRERSRSGSSRSGGSGSRSGFSRSSRGGSGGGGSSSRSW